MASSSKCITGKLKRIVATAIAAILSVGLVSYYPIVKNDNYGIVVEAYSNGNYKVNTASGINVRTGAGTGYSKAGAATNGTSFTVDQISGSWGHTSSIKCTNGTKSSWVCLDYCRQTSTSSSGSSNVSSFQAATYKVNTSSGLNVRTGAGTNYSKKTAVKNGTYLYITSKSGDWGYASNYGGYVSMKYTAFVSNSNLTSGSGASYGVSTAVNIISNYTNYSTPLSNGTAYFITPACATGNVIDVSNSGKNNGANILSWSKHGGTNQQFKAVYLSNGYYTFYNVNSGKVIDVSGGIVANGTNIQIYEYNGTASQQWRLISAGNGYYYLQSKLNSSYYLDVSGASSSNGANVQLYKGNASNAQKFKFTTTSSNGGSSNSSYSLSKLKPLQQGNYSNVKYVHYSNKTVASSGCGTMATINAVRYLTGKTIDVSSMAYWAGENQYVYDVGSYHTIAQAAAKKYGNQYGFSCSQYKTFSSYPSASEYSTIWNLMVSHLQRGEVAVTLVKGHFIAIVDYDSSTNKVLVYDSAASSSRGTTTSGDWKSYDELRYGSGVCYSKLKIRDAITFLCKN